MPTPQQKRILLSSQAWLPSKLAGLALWLRADSLALADGTAVSSWSDESGNGRHATQGTGTKQPLCKTGIINGKPVVRFDGTDDFLATASFDLSASTGVTLFAVFSGASGSDRMVLENSTNAGGSSTGFAMYRDASNKLSTFHRSASYSDFVSTATITATPAVASAVFDKALSTNEVTNWINGTSAGTRGNNANNTGGYGNNACYIGSRAGTSLLLNGDIAEIILYGSALDVGSRQQVERYLGAKYAITVAS